MFVLNTRLVFASADNIYIIGDSMSVLLSQKFTKLMSADSSWKIIGLGVGGTCTDEITNQLQKVIDAGDASYVIIWGGTNDELRYNGYGGYCAYASEKKIKATGIEKNLQKMYDMAHNAGIKVIAIGLSPVRNNIYSQWTEEMQKIQDTVNVWLPTAKNVDYYIPVYDQLEDEYVQYQLNKSYSYFDFSTKRLDYLHLNDTGNTIVGNLIKNNVIWIHSSTPTCSASFSPTSITAPDTSYLTFSSTGDKLIIECAGPLPVPYGDYELTAWDNYPFKFDGSQTGTETCTFTPYKGTTSGAPCSASVEVSKSDSTLPTCIASWNPKGPIAVGETSTLRWASTDDADGVLEYVCTGPWPINEDGVDKAPISGALPYTTTEAGTETCQLTAKSQTGKTATCSASLVIGGSDPSDVILSGTIRKNDQTPIPNVKINIVHAGTVVTDANGKWSKAVSRGTSFALRVDETTLPAGYEEIWGVNNTKCHLNASTYEWQKAGEVLFLDCSNPNNYSSWDSYIDSGYDFEIKYSGDDSKPASGVCTKEPCSDSGSFCLRKSYIDSCRNYCVGTKACSGECGSSVDSGKACDLKSGTCDYGTVKNFQIKTDGWEWQCVGEGGTEKCSVIKKCGNNWKE